MPASKCRKFTVADGMILVAATAVEFWMLSLEVTPNQLTGWELGPALVEYLRQWVTGSPGAATRTRDFVFMVIDLILGLSPLLLVPTMTVFVLRLRRPRPSIRRLVRQPGFATSLAVVWVWAVNSVTAMISMVYHRLTGGRWDMYVTPELGSLFVPIYFRELRCDWYEVAVLAIWSYLLVGRLARSEAGWIDRLGRVLGGCWMFLFLLRRVEDSF